ncbi:site-specific integrase [Segetibacter sp. 3557_3]|uniref:site-specific integrase n=1 Tax=Segetibacter sp. 3557_3 TaxID=2547429 RepID=UPI0010585592|nr:site-specific integrase [Segetibacter sp. 3557_3]TDH19778.1 site-specific integrase [Segetibacter sp. 3557_3]
MNSNFSLLFYLKKPKNYTAGPVPIYLRITVDGKRAEISAGRECDPLRWNSKASRLIGTKEEVKSLNALLDNLQSKVYDAHRRLSEQRETITALDIKDVFTGSGEKNRMLMETFSDHNRKIAALVGKEFAKGTLQRYETSFRHTREFLRYRYGVSDIDIKKIDHCFIEDYDFYLRTVCNCLNNSAVKYVKNFKKIIRICMANGWIVMNPFSNYKGRVKTVDRICLTAEEIQRITEKKFATDRLEHVRDVFLFCCYTGLAYADVKKLKACDVSKGIDGELWIFTYRQKTETRSAVPLLPAAVELIEKYANDPVCLSRNIPLPVPSNQKMNDYLKEIAAVCGINKMLTSHIARHTFATTITLTNGVPIETVSKMLGHSSLKQTQHYAKIIDSKVSSDMLTLREKLSR